MTSLMRTLDRAIGDRVAEGVCSHHTRRLQRVGSDALQAPAFLRRRFSGKMP